MGRREVSIPSDRDAVRIHVVTPEEERKYFEAAARLHALHCKSFKEARPNMADVARIILDQGPRSEEVRSTRVEDFDSAARTLKIRGGKTRAVRRTLSLTPGVPRDSEAAGELWKRVVVSERPPSGAPSR
jgi:integrase